jgi:uncharacterized protein YcbK (DUF882 family)
MINLDSTVPNCLNFQWWELFVTDVSSYKPDKRRFSDVLFKEFLLLPEIEQNKILNNLQHVLQLVQYGRDVLKIPIPIASGWRSKRLNILIGSKASCHTDGMAIDPLLSGEKLNAFLTLFTQHSGGLGKGLNQGHIDILRRPPYRRWTY